MKKIARFLSLLLALVLLMGCVPLAASAASVADILRSSRWTCPLCGEYNMSSPGTRCSGYNCFYTRPTAPSHSISLEDANGENSYGQWETLTNNRMKFRCKLFNNESSRTVKAVELYLYAKNVWDERVYGENIVYTGTTTRNIKPGETCYSDYMIIPQRSEVHKVVVFIHRIAYTDGTTIEIPSEDREEITWTINW